MARFLELPEIDPDPGEQFRQHRILAEMAAEPGAILKGVSDERIRGRLAVRQPGVDAGR